MRLLFIACVFLASFVQTPTASGQVAAKLDALLSPYVKTNGPGFAVTVVSSNRVIYKNAFGYANIDKRVPFDADTAVDLASVSKQFTAMGIMILAEHGKLKY